ncbi:hypothetical protein TWF569_008890 [Orbilia oligospora]|uniref:Pyridoxal phosphate-dependent transferase n=1 Tax=Orbilia oligospora TaxID=2813651 RepID=A0A7C8JQL6_ORBOL|nr:hypothetical protein TWF706_010625 [Orbilia oligospora]KAF3139864.1 hypothetical protein TWF703_003442 [Orbilia oligospora]KAF3143141.1 hypothetical protein TWF594_005208 [Orbilia oligospora]KAF3155520.1 hypothetical protein TWF569_008890 [Orbilia oligospora]
MVAPNSQVLTVQSDFSTVELKEDTMIESFKLKDSKPAVTIISVSELPSSTSSSPSNTPRIYPQLCPPKIAISNPVNLQSIFESSQVQWIDDPVITSWRNPNHKIYNILASANELLEKWTSIASHTPFSPLSDPLWLETGRILKDVGLPWHNNQVGMADDLDSSWPFHFKSYERDTLRAKGSRVGDPNASGYICHPSEANCYCIRALQQELREQYPQSQPLVVYDKSDQGILYCVETFFGLQSHQINLSDRIEDIVDNLREATGGTHRPVIFIANLATVDGKYDDINVISEISKHIPMLLHLDMTQNFDYITTLPQHDRKLLGIDRINLGSKSLTQPLRLPDGSITACTIVAGGTNHTNPPLALALKPTSLGGTDFVRVSYVRGRDQTLAGSRDSIGPLWFSLQEVRFGERGFREIYQCCREMRENLVQALNTYGISIIRLPYSLDIIIRDCSKEQAGKLLSLGAVSTHTGVLLAIQPSVTSEDLEQVVEIMSSHTIRRHSINPTYIDFSSLYQIPQSVSRDLSSTVESWKILTRSSSGYPLYMGSLSALGPAIGQFLGVEIPADWLNTQKKALLVSRMQSFGLLTPKDRANFRAAFTNGSTMGNRMGLQTALKRLPKAIIYFSTETHYSVIKTMRDCDIITRRWLDGKPKFSQIPCNKDGSISIDLLVQRALVDQQESLERGEEYQMILLGNIGTTFVGARDGLKEIYRKLREVGIRISHLHADGAFDFGYSTSGIKLGPPGAVGPDGVPMVQGITLSNHKAMGSIVSGEVISYSPGNELSALEWTVDPRIIFERWFYSQAYPPAECEALLRYCQDNASRLEQSLRRIGVVTKRNPGSMIVVLEKPPAWIIEEFALRPEGDWVHFITVPDISPETIDLFVDRIQQFKSNCLAAFSYINPPINTIMNSRIETRCIQSRDPLAKQVVELAKGAASLVPGGNYDSLASTVIPSMRSALSIAMLNILGQELEAVLLIESFHDQTMKVGALLIKSYHVERAEAIVAVAKILSGFMAKHTGARLISDESSYTCYMI